jgi:hypothetical protein
MRLASDVFYGGKVYASLSQRFAFTLIAWWRKYWNQVWVRPPPMLLCFRYECASSCAEQISFALHAISIDLYGGHTLK